MSRWLERLDDALNPIVVKELRQAVRGRFLPGMLLFFLFLELTVVGGYLLFDRVDSADLVSGGGYGSEVFQILMVGLAFVLVLCLPVYAGFRLGRERAGTGFSLLYVTTLEPRRIVAGKLLSNLVLALLVISTALPYLSFTYFLRGIDLPSVLTALAVMLLTVVAVLQLALFLAALPVGRLLRSVLGLGGLLILVFLFFWSAGLAVTVSHSGVGSRLGDGQFLLGVAVVVGIEALVVGGLFMVTVALVTPPVADRAKPVRRYLTVAWLLSGGLVAWGSTASGDEEVFVFWLVAAVTVLLVALLAALSGRDRLGRRLAGELPRGRFRRAVAFLFSGGAAGGLAWVLLLLLPTLVAGRLMDEAFSVSIADSVAEVAGFAAFGVGYALAGFHLRRRLLARWIQPGYAWAVALGVATAASLLPPIVAFLVSPETIAEAFEDGPWLLANPFSAFHHSLGPAANRLGFALAAAMLLLSGLWLVRRMREFRPPADPGGGQKIERPSKSFTPGG
jgi:hypothetical protein